MLKNVFKMRILDYEDLEEILLYFDENKILYFSTCNFLNNVYRKFFIKNIQISNNKGK